MKPETVHKTLFLTLVALILWFVPMDHVDACTRAVFLGPEGTIITGRSMDLGGKYGNGPLGVSSRYETRWSDRPDLDQVDVEVWQCGLLFLWRQHSRWYE